MADLDLEPLLEATADGDWPQIIPNSQLYICYSLRAGLFKLGSEADGQSSSSNDKPTEAKNRPKGKRRYPKVNFI